MSDQRPGSLAIIIGAMKAGTSTLFEHLAHHPSLAPCAEKEPDYFTSPLYYGLGRDWYEGLYDYDETRHAYRLEASTDLTKLPYTEYGLDRLERSSYPCRFVYLLRDPIARIESHHVHAARTGFEVLTLRPVGRTDFSFDEGVSEVALDVSRYARHLDAYAARFGRDAIHVCFFEDLVRDPQEVVSGVCAFLGIEDLPVRATVHENRGSKAVLHPAWKAARSIGPLRTVAKGVLPTKARHALYGALGTREREGRFRMTGEERASVLAELAGDLTRLRDEYGVDIEARWGIDL